ncbi:MAG: hypothetical protein HY985_16750 [Magnetospirillum sp.]|nr:hypothetical protein [Magnetospirillum sp.]
MIDLVVRGRGAVFLFVFLLSACALPQPFRHDEGAAEDLARPRTGRAVAVPAVAGSPHGRAAAEAMVKALVARDIPATGREDLLAPLVLQGAVEEGGIRWTLRGGEGEVGHLQPISPTGLLRGDPTALRIAAETAAAALAPAFADPHAGQVAAAAPRPRATIRLTDPAGLPGDGDKALPRAMRTALERAGVVVRDTDVEHHLEARVTVSPGRPGEELLTVVWVLKRADGRQLAAIDQQGAVPKGRLDGPWGSLAGDIAAGGADGVLQALSAVKPSLMRPVDGLQDR